MNVPERGLWMFCLFPALTMSLGWGLRGFIGGGPLGAMIPGALVALTLCLLLDRDASSSGLIAAFGAVGFGLGGGSYGQTVGFILKPETYLWGLAGLALKGAVWGLMGGAVLGAALDPKRIARTRMLPALALIAAGAHLGWKWINEPKLLYFSNRLDQPRAEIWAGVLLGALLFLGFLARTGGAGIPARFALAGALGGGLGFGAGGTLMALGISLPVDHRWYPWWKLMELAFGFCLGLSLGAVAYLKRDELRAETVPPGRELGHISNVWFTVTGTALLAAGLMWAETHLRIRSPYALAGVILLSVALFARGLAWQIAVPIVYFAAAADLAEFFSRTRKLGDPAWGWGFAIVTSLALSCWLALRQRNSRPLLRWSFLVLMWACVAVSWLKALMHPWPLRGGLVVETAFTAAAVLLTWVVSSRPLARSSLLVLEEVI